MKILKMIAFFLLGLIFTFCGGKSDQEIFDEAVDLAANKEYDKAVVLFDELVLNYDESSLVPKALFESAKIYQGQVIKKLNSRESLLKSIEVYKQIYDKYPASEEAENSLFMAGFIYANDLNDLEGAKKTYELYLEKFPNGELADDAKVELENLGKTPEEILMEKLQEEESDVQAI